MFKTIIFLLAMICSANALSLEKLILLSEENAPYNYTEDGVPKGMAIDILREVYNRINIELDNERIVFGPWARQYRRAQRSNERNMIFTITRSPKRENLFQWAGPFTYGRSVIFGRTDAKNIKSVNDLFGKKIGVIRDDIAKNRLLDAGIPISNIVEVGSKEQLYSMLMKKRYDYFCRGELTTYFDIKESKIISRDNIKIIHINSKGGLYFGFNKSVDQATVNSFKKLLDEVLQDKRFMQDKIFSVYY